MKPLVLKALSSCTMHLDRPIKATGDAAKAEPMFFNFNGSDLLRGAGLPKRPLTIAFLERLQRMGWDLGTSVVDSRTHMLMPGWYPCIPGWHHDDVPRTRADLQPNYEDQPVLVEHAMMLCGDPVAPTEFLMGAPTLVIPPSGSRRPVYASCHDQIEDQIAKSHLLLRRPAAFGSVIEFNSRTWHRGVAAERFGWRWFIRASRKTPRVATCTNEIRSQVQIYIAAENAGW